MADHRPLLRDAGFVVELYEEPAGWKRCERAIYERIRAAQRVLREEMGEVAGGHLITQALTGPAYLPFERRILVVARKR